MDESKHIVEARPDNFRSLVLANSANGPVLVYYWSPDTGPCMRLLPRLVKLADDFTGQFLLALLNTDEHQAFARDQGVISIPTVRVYYHEQIAETIHGAYSEQLFRGVIEKYIPRVKERAYGEASRAYQRGELSKAVELMDKAAAELPEDHRLRLDQAKLLIQQGDYSKAMKILDELPTEALHDPEIDLLRTHLDFIVTAATAPESNQLQTMLTQAPDDHLTRYQLSARQLIGDEYESALENLWAIVEQDASALKTRAQRGMLAVLAILGPEHPIAQRYQDRIQKSLN